MFCSPVTRSSSRSARRAETRKALRGLQTISLMLLLLLANAAVAQGNDSQPQASAQSQGQSQSDSDQQGTAPAPAFGQSAPILTPENPPISGIDEPRLDLRRALRSYISGGLGVSESADTNPA